MTTINFIQKGTEFIKKAVEKDNNEEYEDALNEYTKGLQYLMTGLKYEKNTKVKNAIKAKATKYLTRAEEIKESLTKKSKKKKKKKKKKVKYSYPSNEYLNETVKETKQREMYIIYGYVHQNEKLLNNINYDIPRGIINLCLIYYHKPEKIEIPSMYNSIIIERPSIKWEQVIGLTQPKQILKEKLILPLKFPNLFTGKHISKGFVLLYGPPGCGKSYLAKALANEVSATYFSVSSADFVSKYYCEGEKLIKQLFQIASEKKPSIILLDEIDSICVNRDYQYSSARRLRTELLVQLHGLKSDAGVYIIACTNVPWQVKSDKAMNRRIEQKIYIGLPSKDDRKLMFESYMNQHNNLEHNLSQEHYLTLSEMTQGFSGSDINCCFRDVLFEPVRQLQKAKYFKRIYENEDDKDSDDYKLVACDINDDGAFKMTIMDCGDGNAERIKPNPIQMKDFIRVLSNYRASVSDEDIARHLECMEDWNDTQ